jgi:hypothetical protein
MRNENCKNSGSVILSVFLIFFGILNIFDFTYKLIKYDASLSIFETLKVFANCAIFFYLAWRVRQKEP